MSSTDPSGPPVVVLDGVRRTYGSGEGAVDAVRDLSLSFRSGTFHAILGPSGSGKSTLLHLASGLDRPTRGTVTLLGKSVGGLDDTELARLRRRHVGFVFQFFNLVPTLTVEENALLPILLDRPVTAADRERLALLLEMMELTARRRRRPEDLSGGERQRAAIVRAMIARPAVLFADEPTGNLDSATGALITRHLRDQAKGQGACLVVVTHDLRVAKQADEVIHMRDGLVVARGSALEAPLATLPE
jgi:putative ABC transport system ATP-binding protein